MWWPHGAELTVEHLKMTEAAAEATISDNQVTFDLSQYSSNRMISCLFIIYVVLLVVVVVVVVVVCVYV